MIENVTIGSDVEYFLFDNKNNEFISAEGLVKGEKSDPFKFDPSDPFFATQLDCVLAEGNIPPVQSVEDFFRHLTKLEKYIQGTLPPNIVTRATGSARIAEKYLQTKTAQEFGCDPSFSCWTDKEIIVKGDGSNLRSAGFHIHVGYSDPSIEDNVGLGRIMDLYLGVPSVFLEPPNERRKVGYGESGNCRHQPHGLEYRSLSSHFASSEKLIKWTYSQTLEAIKAYNNGMLPLVAAAGDRIQEAINKEHRPIVKELIEEFGIKLL